MIGDALLWWLNVPVLGPVSCAALAIGVLMIACWWAVQDN